MKTERAFDPIFRQKFLLYHDCDFNEFHKEVTGGDYDGNANVIEGYTINTDESEICIWVKDIKNIPALIHELCHAMQFALYSRCLVDHREYELPAYYLEFLTKNFFENAQEDKE